MQLYWMDPDERDLAKRAASAVPVSVSITHLAVIDLTCRTFGCTSVFARWFGWPLRVCTWMER